MNQPGVPQQQGSAMQNNPYVTPQMLEYKAILGIPEFTLDQIQGNPQMLQAYQAGDENSKNSIEAQWLSFQLNHYFKEKNEGRWYPALGDQNKPGAQQQGGGQQNPDNELDENGKKNF